MVVAKTIKAVERDTQLFEKAHLPLQDEVEIRSLFMNAYMSRYACLGEGKFVTF